MTSAAPSPSAPTLSGPVAICVDRPVLSLDRPFTYDLPEEFGAGVGSLVQVPFHGRRTRGWVLGPTDDVPARVLKVAKAVSTVRFFDARLLDLYRWTSERYVAPLATVIGRSHPPRVAGEEVRVPGGTARGPSAFPAIGADLLEERYAGGPDLLAALASAAGTFVLRPGPTDEVQVAVGCVTTVLAAGRSAVVVVPEVDPLPATAAAVLETVGDAGVLFAGGDRRSRYRDWLDIGAGRYRVVVGTRPAVFAPLADLGLVFISRESHALHREERSPSWHTRDVAVARGRVEGAVTVLSAPFPSVETRAIAHRDVVPRGRSWPPVEVVQPGPEGRAPRLVAALREARRGFLYSPLPGYGIARVCRACGEPAACSICGGMLRAQEGEVRCAVCEAPGRCARCGAAGFGIAPGGAERVEEWARRAARVPVDRIGAADIPRPPREAEILVGGVEAVKEFGALGLDLVAILDADLAARRPGLGARERALATWFEAAGWAAPNGRVIVQTREPNDAAVQALVQGRPERFHREDAERRAQAGFPVGFPVFRVVGIAGLGAEMEALRPHTLLVSELGEQTVCLLALEPGEVAAFGRAARALAERGILTRVEAEPHL